jgi:hypothetical protein
VGKKKRTVPHVDRPYVIQTAIAVDQLQILRVLSPHLFGEN